MKKKLVAALLAATMTLGLLAGCGSSGDTSSSGDAASSGSSSEAGASGEVDTSKEVELVMYVISDRPAGQDIVDENINAILKEKLNCTLKFNWSGWAEYSQKYPLLF